MGKKGRTKRFGDKYIESRKIQHHFNNFIIEEAFDWMVKKARGII